MIVIKRPVRLVGSSVRPELEILVGAKPRIIVSDTALHSDDPFVVGEYFDMSGAVGTRFRIDGEINPARFRRRQLVATVYNGHRGRPAAEAGIIV